MKRRNKLLLAVVLLAAVFAVGGAALATQAMLVSNTVVQPPLTYEVTYFHLDENGEYQVYAQKSLQHGTVPGNTAGTPSAYPNHIFLGWDQAASQPVTGPTAIYALYEAVPGSGAGQAGDPAVNPRLFTVYHKIVDGAGNDVDAYGAEQFAIELGKPVTLNAKLYRTDLVPEVRSQALTLNDYSVTEYTFLYHTLDSVITDLVDVTVRHFEYVGNDWVEFGNETIPGVNLSDRTYTYYYDPVTSPSKVDYAPDALEKTITLTKDASKNVINFYHTPTGTTEYLVYEYFEQADAPGFRRQPEIPKQGALGAVVREDANTSLPWYYTWAPEISKDTGIITNGSDPKLVLRMYYRLVRHNYEIRYVDELGQEISGRIAGLQAKHGQTITEAAPSIADHVYTGYSVLHGANTQVSFTQTDDGASAQIIDDGTVIVMHYHRVFEITPSVENGTIIPGDVIYVKRGENQTFTFAPNPGTRLARLYIDRVLVEDAYAYESYTFVNVQSIHTIDVIYEQLEFVLTVRHVPLGWNSDPLAPDEVSRLVYDEAYTYAPLALEGYEPVSARVTPELYTEVPYDAPVAGRGNMPEYNLTITIYYRATGDNTVYTFYDSDIPMSGTVALTAGDSVE